MSQGNITTAPMASSGGLTDLVSQDLDGWVGFQFGPSEKGLLDIF